MKKLKYKRNDQFMRFISVFTLLLLSFYGSAIDQNLASYRLVKHSSSIDPNQCGHLVVDGSPDTYWESDNASQNQWLLIDLGALQTIDHLLIHWGENYATSFKLTLLAKSNEPGDQVFITKSGTGGDQDLDCRGLKARFLRLDISKVKDPIRGCVIKEILVPGEGPDRFTPSKVVTLSASNLSLDGDIWNIQSSMFVSDNPGEISSSGYDDTNWIPARVPGTILESYYESGALPDPLFGDNMHQISDEFFSGNDFWYRTSVLFPSSLSGQRIFLNFSGINWKSDIYFNGQHLGKIDGAFMRGVFEVTKLIDFAGTNTVAVLVHHNENWVSSSCKVIRKYLGARTTNGDMLGFDGPTCLASAGWNWLPIIKGRNNGIWNHAGFTTGGNVRVKDTWVESCIPLPDTSKAELSIHTDLINLSAEAVEGKIKAELCGFEIELPVKLLPNEEKSLTLDKSVFSELQVDNPALWWPNGYGAQALMKLNIHFEEKGEVSDSEVINFGIRQLDYTVKDDVLFVYCNGTRILLRGGNWGLPEAMMRLDESGYDLRVKLHKEANFNMIRNWIGMTHRVEFYNACDKYGILIFDDFWLANPVDGPNPRDFNLFMSNVRDKIKWVRKHPSLAIYCGRNEGLPPLKYDLAMKKECEQLDGTRHYIPHSSEGTVTGLGPYDVRPTEWYFENRGKTFHTELGIVAIPEVESMRKMMPEENWWPINDMWAIHDYQAGRSDKFTDTLYKRYGEASNLEDYCNKAQLFNYESAKAMFECLQSNQGSGVLLWMSQSAWPSMICQLYDHYLEYTSSYFAVKKAASPVHAFWDVLKKEVLIANNTRFAVNNADIEATIYDALGKMIWTKTKECDLHPTSAISCFPLDPPTSETVLFLKLELKSRGTLLSENFYWLENSEGNCLDLNDLPVTNVEMKIDQGYENGFITAQIKLNNVSESVSIMNRIKLKDTQSGESVLPVFFDDDYVTLLPGEKKTITMKIEEKYLENRDVEINLEGWNTSAQSSMIDFSSYRK
ncbi:MAG: discoidin domain-containing protein [Bacteroidales bacterium]